MTRRLTTLLICWLVTQVAAGQTIPSKLRVGVVGMVHSHVHQILRLNGQSVEVVGIAEPNRQLAEQFARQYNFPMSLVYASTAEMLDKTKPEAIADFGRIVDHRQTVEICAPRGIHVMVEKPLATSFADAKRMAALARQHNIQLLTNYETTWYESNHRAYGLVYTKKAIGDIRKIVVHDGHQGPKEIGVMPEFLVWLTDPVANGAGALFDFGCYGANLSTWLMRGQRPTSVLAVTQQIKPDIYPNVDDEATIILTYPKTQAVIQASWNWPYARKDMEVYGQTGSVFAIDSKQMQVRLGEKELDKSLLTQSLNTAQADGGPSPVPAPDPFTYLARLLRGEINPDELTSLDNNLIVMEILDAARQSAKTGRAIKLN